MILILSTPRDFDTQEVIDWLKEKNAVFFRLNDEDLISGNVEFKYNPKKNKTLFFNKTKKKFT